MIPIRDTIPSSRVPVVTYLLIAANLGLFFYEISLGENLPPFLARYALIPARFLGGELSFREILTPVTAMFLHAGWMHVLGNMLYLYIFGDNVEDTLGHGRFLLFYLTCGVASFAVQIGFQPVSSVPNIGASGAIAGVLGAYFFLFPRARVVTLLPLFIFFPVVEIPAVVFLGIWFLIQLGSGTISLEQSAAAGGVAWWAHVGGFLAGVVLLKLFTFRRRGRGAATV
jgi:membrane associated rhomboid family serine protease